MLGECSGMGSLADDQVRAAVCQLVWMWNIGQTVHLRRASLSADNALKSW